MIYRKIYIVGCVGCDQSTLARNLANKLNIDYYELDKIIWDDNIGIKRSNIDRDKINWV